LQLNEFIEKYKLLTKIKFLLIGGSTALIYFSSLFLFNDILKINPNLSLTISYIISVVYHFMMNKFFVFQEKKILSMRYQIIQYGILTLINYLINLGIANIFLYFKSSIYLSVVAATAVTMFLTYFIMNKLIFKKQKKEGVPND